MGMRWELRGGVLVEVEKSGSVRSGDPSAAASAPAPDVASGVCAVELFSPDEAAACSFSPLGAEVLRQLPHAAIPFVECGEAEAAGAVVMSPGAQRAAGARRFAFVLTARTLALVDASGLCPTFLKHLAAEKTAVETPAAVLCALLSAQLRDHPAKLSMVRDDIERLEEQILEGCTRVNRAMMMADTRRMLGLDAFYQGMSDLTDLLAEKGGSVVAPGDRAQLRMLSRQLDRLSTRLESLQDYSLQVHSLYQESIDVRQNNVMQWLTVVATIAMPLTFITGWYGMNFPHMMLIDAPWGYPFAVTLCVVVAALEIAFFHRRGWLAFGGATRRSRRSKRKDRPRRKARLAGSKRQPGHETPGKHAHAGAFAPHNDNDATD